MSLRPSPSTSWPSTESRTESPSLSRSMYAGIMSMSGSAKSSIESRIPSPSESRSRWSGIMSMSVSRHDIGIGHSAESPIVSPSESTSWKSGPPAPSRSGSGAVTPMTPQVATVQSGSKASSSPSPSASAPRGPRSGIPLRSPSCPSVASGMPSPSESTSR